MEPYVCFDQHPLYLRTIGVRETDTSLAMFDLPERSERLYFTYYDIQIDVAVTRLDRLLSIELWLDLPEQERSENGYISLWMGGDYSRGPTYYVPIRDGHMIWAGIVPRSEKMGIYIAL